MQYRIDIHKFIVNINKIFLKLKNEIEIKKKNLYFILNRKINREYANTSTPNNKIRKSNIVLIL